TVPFFTTPEFFRRHDWIPPYHQAGHKERTQMVAAALHLLVEYEPEIQTLLDLGCGDGSLLDLLADLPVVSCGMTAGIADGIQARNRGHEVIIGDFLSEVIPPADVIVMTEVLEHLIDPHELLTRLPAKFLLLSSPSAETDEWHYEHHAWAWDMDGYRAMIESAGWEVLAHAECDAPVACHGGIQRSQRFQAVTARRS